MTDLQASLIGIGVAIVVGVIAYNKWQEYRAKKHVERAFSDPVDDVLMKTGTTETGTQRQEPVLDGFAAPDGKREPSLGETETAAPQEDGFATEKNSQDNAGFSEKDELPVDELIDCEILLSLEEPARSEKILPQLQTLRYTGNKPVHFVGLVEDEQGQTSWQPVVPGKTYVQLKAGVQLANRTSALNEIEFSELLMRLRQVADAIGAEPDIPEMGEVTEKAKQLFQFVADHDAKLGISIRSNGAPWQVATLNAALEKQGFESRPDGLFVMKDRDNGLALFTLSTNELPASEIATRLTLLLDVPCVAPEKDGFSQMIQCAKALCVRLDGSLIDDGNQLLNDAFLEEIGDQVKDFYKEMHACTIPAGSVRALRLFN